MGGWDEGGVGSERGREGAAHLMASAILSIMASVGLTKNRYSWASLYWSVSLGTGSRTILYTPCFRRNWTSVLMLMGLISCSSHTITCTEEEEEVEEGPTAMASFPPTFLTLGSPRSCISSVRAVVCSSPVFTFEPIKCAEDIFHCAALSLLPATLTSPLEVTRPRNHAHKHTY